LVTEKSIEKKLTRLPRGIFWCSNYKYCYCINRSFIKPLDGVGFKLLILII